jgi:O-acetyl-ADP-ribose deacetylase (regulator of RNase III)/predicted RNA-binding Zn-ribbon protein involved in translation (DUF1610 family)
MAADTTARTRRVGEPANAERPRRRFADFRAARKDARWKRALDWREVTAGGFKTPAQACPHGCGQRTARRELLTWAGWSGRIHSRVLFEFETSNCPDCGSRLIDRCHRCEEPFAAPVGDRCEHCGLPQPWSPERRISDKRLPLRRWAPGGDDAREPAETVYSENGIPKLLVIEHDITNVAVEAIVSNDDVDGRMYTVIASAIKAAAGQQVEDESIERGRAALGDAWSTAAGALRKPLKRIVHTAAMDRRGHSGTAIVVKCVRSALRVAREEKIESLGIPAFGTGPRDSGRPVIHLAEWLRAVGPAIVQDLQESPGDPALTVLLVLYEPEDFIGAVNQLDEAVAPLRAARPQEETSHDSGAARPEAAEDRVREQPKEGGLVAHDEDEDEAVEVVEAAPGAVGTFDSDEGKPGGDEGEPEERQGV